MLNTKYGVGVLHPTELINEIDSLQREAEYRPARLEGSRLLIGLLKAEHIASIIDALRLSPQEKVSEFEKLLRYFLGRPKDHESVVTFSPDKAPLALRVKNMDGNGKISVPLFRLSGHSLAPTVARHMLR